ncbi:MAG: hypothetical protein QJR02_00805 [Sinobacteraceae bacterium]|nr:hypothetical protein [Nevskiaceae bacterium]
MKHALPLATLVALLGLTACNGNTTAPFSGEARAVNGITDSNGLDTSISNIQIASNTPFGSATGINSPIPEGSYKAQLTSNSVTFTVDNVSIDHNHVTTVFAAGQIGNGSETGFAAEEALNAPTNGQAVVQPVNAALQATGKSGSLTFRFVPTNNPSSATSLTAQYGTSPASAALTGGTYEIIVSDGATTVFDSGPQGIALPSSNGGNVFQVAAIDAGSSNQSKYGSSIALLLMDDKGQNTPLYNLQH